MKIKFHRNFYFILALIFLASFSCILFFGKENDFNQLSYNIEDVVIEDNEVWQIIFNEKGDTKSIQLTDDGFEKNVLLVSPDNKKISYSKHLYSKPIYQNKESYYDNYTALMVYDLESNKEKEIFRGDFFTTDHQWLDDENIRVYRLGGTGVRGYTDININISKPLVAAERRSSEFWETEIWDTKLGAWISN